MLLDTDLTDNRSTLVFGADTWLHITTTTVSITKLTAIENNAAPYSLSLLSPNCTATNNNISSLSAANLQCTIDTVRINLISGATVLQTLNNQSNAISVLSDGPDPSLAYLTITPSNRDKENDFSATTFGIRSTCRPITSSCNMSIVNTPGAAFNCSGGKFALDSSKMALFYSDFFDDEAMTQEASGGVSNNPFYFTVADAMQPSAKPLHNLANDPEIVSTSDFMGIIIQCSVEVFDIEYDVIAGQVTNMTTSRSNSSVANVFEPAMVASPYGTPNIQNALLLDLALATSAQDLADLFSLSFSKIALSVGAGSVVTGPALAAQSRKSALVAKVLKAPLFMLVICNVGFIVMGCMLALAAIRSSTEAREVQSRLNITGIVAYMFDGEIAKAAGAEQSVAAEPEKLYAEYYRGEEIQRIGVGRGKTGGFEYRKLESDVRATGIELSRPVERSLNKGGSRSESEWI